MAPIQETISSWSQTQAQCDIKNTILTLFVKNVLALCYPFLEVWRTAVFQANAPRSHIPERFRLGFLQLSAQWHAWLVLSQLIWVQKKKGAWRISTWHLKYLKEWKKRQFVQLAGIHRCNKSSHRSQRGHIWAFLILENREQIISYTGLTGEFVPQIISNDEFYSCSISEMLTYPINVQ